MTHRPPLEFTRRLLDARQVATKLNIGISILSRGSLRKQFEDKEGFPPPILGAGIGSGRKVLWDERAIDLWLDSRLPARLRDRAFQPAPRAEEESVIAARLNDRLQGMQL